ncbi:hypothetical protein [Streptomyces showdoensis]|uniref:phage baseplate protein n=1 Tax=Streptomyces showdoensis TaxID=68268 RepID=UPI00103B0BC6|nr:hypothetical protein [Streptomyces showdoensis]
MSVTIEGQIDIAGPVGKLLHRRRLHNATVMQSFGIDPVSGDVFVLQVMEDGIQLAGETAPVSYDTRKADGDLCLTRLTEAGVKTGYMYLRGFGHGVSLGVENRAGTIWLWTETASKPNSKNEGYGSAVTSFPYAAGDVVTYGTTRHTQPYTPDPAARFITPTIDRATNELVLRFSLNGTHWERYDLAKAANGVWEPVQRITPALPSAVFQGYASHAGILYTLQGEAYSAANPLPGNTYLTAIEWATGNLLDRQFSAAAPGLEYREPEGMAVSVRGGVPHLHFGFACEDPGPRTCTVVSLSGAPETDGVKVLTDWQPITLAAGVSVDQNAPQGRLISLAGTTTLQLSGGVKGSFDADTVLGYLPDSLTPSVTARANVPRNNNGGYSVARVEAGPDRELRLFGGRSTNVITWAQLDSFSAAWR